jgi:hypothetical protein
LRLGHSGYGFRTTKGIQRDWDATDNGMPLCVTFWAQHVIARRTVHSNCADRMQNTRRSGRWDDEIVTGRSVLVRTSHFQTFADRRFPRRTQRWILHELLARSPTHKALELTAARCRFNRGETITTHAVPAGKARYRDTVHTGGGKYIGTPIHRATEGNSAWEWSGH